MSAKDIQVENCRKLIDIMQSVPDAEYFHSHFFHACGSPSCALGWAFTRRADFKRSSTNTWVSMETDWPQFASILYEDLFGELSYVRIFCSADSKRVTRHWSPTDVIAAIEDHIKLLETTP